MKKLIALSLLALAFGFGPSLGVAADAASAVNVTGTWDAVVETPQGSGTPVFTLQQEGTKLTGKYKGQLGEASVAGSVKGNAVSFSYQVSGEDGKIEYSGVVEGTTMKGKAKFGSESEGSFTAKKRAGN